MVVKARVSKTAQKLMSGQGIKSDTYIRINYILCRGDCSEIVYSAKNYTETTANTLLFSHTHTHLPERKKIYHTLYSTGMNNIILYDTTVIEGKRMSA